MSAFVVVYDANVLYPTVLRDLLIRIAQSGLVVSDEFVMDQMHLHAGTVHVAVQQIADSWRNPTGTVDDVIDRLERDGLIESAQFLRR